MSSISQIEISNNARKKLECFKRVVDAILPQELTFKEYVELVLSREISYMLRDVVPKDVDVLLKSMEQIFDANPDSASNFIVDTLKKGEETQLRKRWDLDSS